MATEYEKYLMSASWQRVRQMANENAGHKCSKCGIPRWVAKTVYKRDNNTHHNGYDNLFNEGPKDVGPLCLRCHEIDTFGRSKFPEVLTRECIECQLPHFNIDFMRCDQCRFVQSYREAERSQTRGESIRRRNCLMRFYRNKPARLKERIEHLNEEYCDLTSHAMDSGLDWHCLIPMRDQLFELMEVYDVLQERSEEDDSLLQDADALDMCNRTNVYIEPLLQQMYSLCRWLSADRDRWRTAACGNNHFLMLAGSEVAACIAAKANGHAESQVA